MSYLQKANNLDLVKPPKFIPSNLVLEVIMGSYSYGVATPESDMDLYGVCIPRKEDVFPHLRGEIPGFGRQKHTFEQYQESCTDSARRLAGQARQYDFSIYGIVKYFTLCMENNPNMIDSLFVPRNCITHTTQVGEMIREHRHLFLHKGLWHKFKGYAYSQLNKAKRDTAEGKRKDLIETHGYDIKAGYHVVRLLEECEQALAEGDIDLTRAADVLRAIRRGEWEWARLSEYFVDKERALENLYQTSHLPYGPREEEIKNLLFTCLEHHYGSLTEIKLPSRAKQNLTTIQALVDQLLAMNL